ncbi:hypothetical protein D3C71_681030 [compost metagenome]
MVVAEGRQRHRQHGQGIGRLTQLLGEGVEQPGRVYVGGKARYPEHEAQHHKGDQDDRNPIHRPGRMPDEAGEHQHEQHGGELAIDAEQAAQDQTRGGDIGVQQNATDEIDSQIVEDIYFVTEQILGHRIKRGGQFIGLEGFQQHPAGDRHDDHGENNGQR